MAKITYADQIVVVKDKKNILLVTDEEKLKTDNKFIAVIENQNIHFNELGEMGLFWKVDEFRKLLPGDYSVKVKVKFENGKCISEFQHMDLRLKYFVRVYKVKSEEEIN